MQRRRWIAWIIGLISMVSCLTGCSLPQVSAEDRLFLPLSVEFLGNYVLQETTFKETEVGGLSGITYDRQNNLFYAVSDDRGKQFPARFYTLKLSINPDNDPEKSSLQQVQLQDVTLLQDETGKPFAPDTLDPEGIALSPQGTLFIASEGTWDQQTPPFIGEFDLKTGQLKRKIQLPKSYLPDTYNPLQQQGVQNNRAFESLTVSAGGMKSDPFRLFTATESPLLQDVEPPDPTRPHKNRLLHYLIEGNRVDLIAEHVYPLDPKPQAGFDQGLTDLLAIGQSGHFLSLERSVGLTGFRVKLYQVTTGTATDSSTIASLRGDSKGVQPARKRLLLDFSELGINPDNLEGVTFGPRFPDGSQSLILVSDDNFNNLAQATQFLLFRLKGLKG